MAINLRERDHPPPPPCTRTQSSVWWCGIVVAQALQRVVEGVVARVAGPRLPKPRRTGRERTQSRRTLPWSREITAGASRSMQGAVIRGRSAKEGGGKRRLGQTCVWQRTHWTTKRRPAARGRIGSQACSAQAMHALGMQAHDSCEGKPRYGGARADAAGKGIGRGREESGLHLRGSDSAAAPGFRAINS